MSNDGFIFLLALGSALLAGILTVAHISAYRLTRRREARQQAAAAREPEFEFGELSPDSDVGGGLTAGSVRAPIGHVA